MAREAPPGEVYRQASVDGRTASATPDDGVGGPVPRLPRGATLGRYVVLDCLGSGGMGVVYRAHDFALDRRVSLKLLRPSGKDTDSRRERLVSEAQALARVSHPNVLAVHDVGTWEEEVYVALEHVEGETLRSWLDRAPRSPSEIRGMFLQAARGLQAIHDAGLVHRDVKPENLLVGRDGRLRVADLGLAITAGSAGAEAARETLQPGTPGYMPLEQHRGEPLDARADQFSLAVALHEALVGHRPYGSRGASREALEERLARGPGAEVPRSAAIAPRLRRALTASLSPERGQRPASLASLIDALASPGVQARGTLGGVGAVAASMGVLLLAMIRAGAAPVATAEAAIWLPPAYEFQADGLDPADRVGLVSTAAPQSGPAGVPSREAWTGRTGASVAPVVTPSTTPPRGPEVLTIGRRPPESGVAAAPAHAPGLELDRLAELRGLVQALYRALTEPREGGTQAPLLALSPAPGAGARVPSAGAVASASSPLQVASIAPSGGSGLDYVDPSGQAIATIERRLDQQIRNNRSPPEIAQTRFALAQAIWNSSDATEAQTRALSLARQSKAALDAVVDQDSTVVELREAVNDWISVREGPINKPRGNLLDTRRDELRMAPMENMGLSDIGF
ncbi:MAG TPA: serine/threonine-protein kinase [Myxococcaceae bacterium]|nr:serine/threonine-protein kinase [Myxococcaceae bacterium]